MKFFCALLLHISVLSGFGQYVIIPTDTDSPIHEIDHAGEDILILGQDGFFAKCTGDCDELIGLTSPGYSGYLRNDLNVLDEDTYFLISHKDFPHHGYILKTDDAGLTWDVLLDTTDILFNSFMMYDYNYGSLITSSYQSIHTSDGGAEWVERPHGLIISSTSLRINDTCGVMGITEDFNITTDKGLTWQNKGFPQSPPMAFYADHPDSIFAVTNGATGNYFTFCFDLVEDGWTKRNIDGFVPFDLYVNDLNEVYVVGQFKASNTAGILKTDDLGLTWSFYDTEISGSFYEIEFINDSTALIGGTDGLLMKWKTTTHFDQTGLSDLSQKIEIQLFPNPSGNLHTLSIDINNPVQGSIMMYDLKGKLIQEIFNDSFINGSNSFLVELDGIPSGVYFYRIVVNDDLTSHFKWIKK